MARFKGEGKVSNGWAAGWFADVVVKSPIAAKLQAGCGGTPMSAALFLAILVQAAANSAEPPLLTGVTWTQLPGPEQITSFFPKQAQQDGVSGHATMVCKVREEGTLTDCQVSEETPARKGFGAAALNMAPFFKMESSTRFNQPTAGGTIRVPIRFDAPMPPGTLTPVEVATKLKPTGNDYARYYPDRASRASVGGKATVQCVVGDQGRLNSCSVINEFPEGWDFGLAALHLSALFQLELAAKDGAPVVGRPFRFSITFVLPQG